MIEFLNFLVLGIIIAIVSAVAFLLRDRYTQNLAELTKVGKTYSNKQIFIGMLILLPLGLYLILNIPINWLVPFELCVGTAVISFTAYVLTKNKLALSVGLLYPLLYFYWWETILLNAFAMIIGLGAVLMLAVYIKPKSMFLIAGIIILYDFYMVYVTQDMVSAARKIVETELPMYVSVECTEAPGTLLGLGDIVIASLLVLKISEYYNFDKRCGLFFIAGFSTLSIACLIVAIQITPSAVPATIPIMIAAAITVGLYQLERSKLIIFTGIMCGVLLCIILKMILV